ncbi:nose resistant to fluoxetine protein 6-like [Periplaneta americana]|uniref:nose resistant to fluoxetine protein 6-like n=1 Tax=Periplaneta americana TaxID=6978 RepID=UPI0037E8AA3F
MALSDIKRLVVSFSPYRVMACYAIFFVVRAEGGVKSVVEGPIEELLGSLMAAGDDCVALHHCNANDVSNHGPQRSVELPLPSVFKEHVEVKEDPAPCSSTPSLDMPATGCPRLKERSFHNLFETLPVLAPTSNQIHNEACRKHSRIFVHQLKRYKLWALQMYDSSAKLPSGILRGNVNQLGDFDQCLAVGDGEESPSIDGKYCLASVDVRATALDSNDTETLHHAVDLAQAYGFIKSSHRDPGHFIPRFTTFQWGLCMPASCSSADLQQTLAEALSDYNHTSGLEFNVNVDPDMCYTRQQPGNSLGTATIITIIFFAIIICMAGVGTLQDTRCSKENTNNQGQLQRVIMAFSIRKNLDELLAELPAEGDINCIYGIRAICTIALYLAHKVITLALSPYSNRVTLTEVSNESWGTIFRASLVYTDSFLLLSGVLTSFNLSKELERKKEIDWFKKYVARFIRLTPALLAVVLFYAYVLEHIGTGPQWNLAVKRNADLCKESFWRNILYIQNFFPFEQMCATHTHQLALDMQLSLLSPLLVTLMWQWQAFGIFLLLCLHALSAILRYVATLRNHLSLVIFHGMTVKQLYETANLTYSLSLHRATPYLLGVGLGYLLHKTGKHFHIPKMAVWGGWLLAVYFAYLAMMSPSHLGLRNYEYNVHEASLYAAFSPIVWSLALGWLILACFTGHGGLVNKFLCCRSLVLFSRISYAVYLTQFAVFFYNVGSIRASEQFSLFRSVDMAEVLTVLIVSIFVTLLFDLPMQEVKGILMGGGHRRAKRD